MRHRIQVIIVLFAWFLATGSHWDVAQLVAWTNMFSGYAREMTLGTAVEKTFSGEMCPLCRAVQKGRQEQERNGAKAPAAKTPGKLLDLYPVLAGARVLPPPAGPQIFPPAEFSWSAQDRASPPFPPPRALA